MEDHLSHLLLPSSAELNGVFLPELQPLNDWVFQYSFKLVLSGGEVQHNKTVELMQKVTTFFLQSGELIKKSIIFLLKSE